jgi:hypothetical protein
LMTKSLYCSHPQCLNLNFVERVMTWIPSLCIQCLSFFIE